MATGSGKTKMAITAIYRMIKFGGARRVLFLVDRTNLGEQAEKEFQNYRVPNINRKFTELFQRSSGSRRTASAHPTKVAITTVQRLYSMLKGDPEFDPLLEEGSAFDSPAPLFKEPLPVVYNAMYRRRPSTLSSWTSATGRSTACGGRCSYFDAHSSA